MLISDAPFRCLSLIFGWRCGRRRMVAVLLSRSYQIRSVVDPLRGRPLSWVIDHTVYTHTERGRRLFGRHRDKDGGLCCYYQQRGSRMIPVWDYPMYQPTTPEHTQYTIGFSNVSARILHTHIQEDDFAHFSSLVSLSLSARFVLINLASVSRD